MAGPNQSDFDAAELYAQTQERKKNSQRLSEHVRHVHDTMEDADVQTVLGLLDSWAGEIRQLEDLLDRYRRAVSNLGGSVDEGIR